ncbi:hypothetical protein ACFXPA_13540 [Amycolatopsis sp. NPDC059090]|uniref:hypothetical protein n=1 Tax=unclassified Amycolatopsis TaxID=2618356 RepID=UPI00366B7FA8
MPRDTVGTTGHPSDDEFRRLTDKSMTNPHRSIFDGCGGHYAYAQNDPVNNSDSTGASVLGGIGKLIVATGAAIVGGTAVAAESQAMLLGQSKRPRARGNAPKVVLRLDQPADLAGPDQRFGHVSGGGDQERQKRSMPLTPAA